MTDWWGDHLTTVLEQLSCEHREPRDLVEAAIVCWKDDVRQKQEARELIGKPGLAFVAVRV